MQFTRKLAALNPNRDSDNKNALKVMDQEAGDLSDNSVDAIAILSTGRVNKLEKVLVLPADVDKGKSQIKFENNGDEYNLILHIPNRKICYTKKILPKINKKKYIKRSHNTNKQLVLYKEPLSIYSFWDGGDILNRKLSLALQNIQILNNMPKYLPNPNENKRSKARKSIPNPNLHKDARNLLDHSVETIGLFLTGKKPNVNEVLVFNLRRKNDEPKEVNDTLYTSFICPHRKLNRSKLILVKPQVFIDAYLKEKQIINNKQEIIIARKKNLLIPRQLKSFDFSDKGNGLFSPQQNIDSFGESDNQSRSPVRRNTLQIAELKTKKIFYLSRESSIGERLSSQVNPNVYKNTTDFLDPSFDLSFGKNNGINSPNSDKKQSQGNDDNSEDEFSYFNNKNKEDNSFNIHNSPRRSLQPEGHYVGPITTGEQIGYSKAQFIDLDNNRKGSDFPFKDNKRSSPSEKNKGFNPIRDGKKGTNPHVSTWKIEGSTVEKNENSIDSVLKDIPDIITSKDPGDTMNLSEFGGKKPRDSIDGQATNRTTLPKNEKPDKLNQTQQVTKKKIIKNFGKFLTKLPSLDISRLNEGKKSVDQGSDSLRKSSVTKGGSQIPSPRTSKTKIIPIKARGKKLQPGYINTFLNPRPVTNIVSLIEQEPSPERVTKNKPVISPPKKEPTQVSRGGYKSKYYKVQKGDKTKYLEVRGMKNHGNTSKLAIVK